MMSQELLTDVTAIEGSELDEGDSVLKVSKSTLQEVVNYLSTKPYGEVFVVTNKLLGEISKLNPDNT